MSAPDVGPVVSDLSEDELIASFLPLLPRGRATIVPSGDDCAVVAAPDGRFCVTTDVLVEGRHFRTDWSTGEDVGWRAAVQNLADVAGMGARPTTLVVALVLPASTPVTWLHDFSRGMALACAPLGVGVDGGDLSGGDQLVAAVTAHGDLEGRDPVLRSGARVGDVVAHRGSLGRGAAGHAVLTSGRRGAGDEDLVRDFLRPRPPLDAGPAAATAGATAMMDVSDGLLKDAGRLARASGVVLDLAPPAQSVPEDVAALADVAARVERDPATWVLTGGEDHGILATFPPGTALPPGFRALGQVRDAVDHPAGTVLVGGSLPDVARAGWDHFR